jgi:hypothetical protein
MLKECGVKPLNTPLNMKIDVKARTLTINANPPIVMEGLVDFEIISDGEDVRFLPTFKQEEGQE